ncbi:hypothetical protein B0I62_000726 [Clostridium beijerinckii]|nr:hypothetical protein [Clostridium beijerinckii]
MKKIVSIFLFFAIISIVMMGGVVILIVANT